MVMMMMMMMMMIDFMMHRNEPYSFLKRRCMGSYAFDRCWLVGRYLSFVSLFWERLSFLGVGVILKNFLLVFQLPTTIGIQFLVPIHTVVSETWELE